MILINLTKSTKELTNMAKITFFLYIILFTTKILMGASGDLAIPKKHEEETAAGINLAQLRAERQALTDRLSALDAEQKKVAVLWKNELENLSKEVEFLQNRLSDSAKEASRLEEVRRELVTKVAQMQERLNGLVKLREEVKKSLVTQAAQILAKYEELPDLLKNKAKHNKDLLKTDDSSVQLLMESLVAATAELQHFNENIWTGYENIDLDGNNLRVKVVYFGTVGGTWLSLDEKQTGLLVRDEKKWMAIANQGDLKSITENFNRAAQGVSFYLPLRLHLAAKESTK